MSFIQKLTKDTQDGIWDGGWKYTEASDTYAFNVTKHYLSGLNFSIVKNNKLIIFPNGYGIEYSKESLIQLKNAVDVSLERTVDSDIKEYLSKDKDSITERPPLLPVNKDLNLNKKLENEIDKEMGAKNNEDKE